MKVRQSNINKRKRAAPAPLPPTFTCIELVSYGARKREDAAELPMPFFSRWREVGRSQVHSDVRGVVAFGDLASGLEVRVREPLEPPRVFVVRLSCGAQPATLAEMERVYRELADVLAAAAQRPWPQEHRGQWDAPTLASSMWSPITGEWEALL